MVASTATTAAAAMTATSNSQDAAVTWPSVMALWSKSCGYSWWAAIPHAMVAPSISSRASVTSSAGGEPNGKLQHGADEGRERDEEIPAPRRCAPPCGHHQRDAAGEHGQKSEVHRRRLHGQRRADAVGGADAKEGPHAGGVRQRHVGGPIPQATQPPPGNH